ncbi:hypothetical protein B0H14DRAFT_2821364 [Mycena olivaceomarginata]|nr:hypothetical protein B0H14DRAFT_2821364 [Mycena olivaceomarginata]
MPLLCTKRHRFVSSIDAPSSRLVILSATLALLRSREHERLSSSSTPSLSSARGAYSDAGGRVCGDRRTVHRRAWCCKCVITTADSRFPVFICTFIPRAYAASPSVFPSEKKPTPIMSPAFLSSHAARIAVTQPSFRSLLIGRRCTSSQKRANHFPARNRKRHSLRLRSRVDRIMFGP